MEDTVLRSDDPRCAELEGSGWTLVATSWGARLQTSPELLDRLRRLVARAEECGAVVRELTARDAGSVLALDALTAGDYPGGVATSHEPLDERTVQDLFTRGRAFGVEYAGALAAVTVTEVVGRSGELGGSSAQARVETGFTVVHPDHRGRGLASAVKAASILAHAADGATLFGTGGAHTNEASLAMNRTVGYQITETWHTYRSPAGSSTGDTPPG